MKRAWLWIVAAATAVAGIVLLVLTGRRKTPVVLPPPPERPDTPPVDKPIVTLRPADDYEANKVAPASAPDAVITRINARHSENGDKP